MKQKPSWQAETTTSTTHQQASGRCFRLLFATAALIVLLWLLPMTWPFNHAEGMASSKQTSTPTATLALAIFQSNPPSTDNPAKPTLVIEIQTGSRTGVGYITIINVGLAPLMLGAPHLKLIDPSSPYNAVTIAPNKPLTIAQASEATNTAQISITCNGSLAPWESSPISAILSFTTNDPAHRQATYMVECIDLNPTATPIPTVPTATPPSVFSQITPYPTPTPVVGGESPVIGPDNAQHLQISAIVSRGPINQVAWSHDRTRVAVASGTGVWLYQADALDGPGQHMQGYDGPMVSVIFSPNDDLMVSANGTFGNESYANRSALHDTLIVLWDTRTASAKAVLRGLSGGYILAFSPDEKTLAMANRNTISLWDAATGTKRLEWKDSAIDQSNPNYTTGVLSLAFSPDGKLLASGSSDNVIRFWNPATGSRQAELGTPSEPSVYFNTGITMLAFSPDGKTLASSGADGYMRIWDVQRRIQRVWRGFGQASSIDFSEDGGAIAFLVGGRAEIWQFNTQREPSYLDAGTQWQSLVFKADGTPMALGITHSVWRLWGQPLDPRKMLLPGYDWAGLPIAFGADGNHLVVKGGTLLNLENNQLQSIPGDYCSNSMSLSPNGELVALWSSGCIKLTIWDFVHHQGRSLNIPSQKSMFFDAAVFSPDNQLLVTVTSTLDWPGGIVLWDVQSGNPQPVVLPTQDSSASCSVAISPDGKTLAYSALTTVALWDISSKRVRKTLSIADPAVFPDRGGHGPPELCDLHFSPDGHLLAAAYDYGSGVLFWNVDTGEQKVLLQSPAGIIHLAFSPDGRLLAGAGYSLTIRLWDISSGLQVGSVQGSYDFWQDTQIAFSPDGTTLASANEDLGLYLWRVVD